MCPKNCRQAAGNKAHCKRAPLSRNQGPAHRVRAWRVTLCVCVYSLEDCRQLAGKRRCYSTHKQEPKAQGTRTDRLLYRALSTSYLRYDGITLVSYRAYTTRCRGLLTPHVHYVGTHPSVQGACGHTERLQPYKILLHIVAH